jgi:hypothetical protein
LDGRVGVLLQSPWPLCVSPLFSASRRVIAFPRRFLSSGFTPWDSAIGSA